MGGSLRGPRPEIYSSILLYTVQYMYCILTLVSDVRPRLVPDPGTLLTGSGYRPFYELDQDPGLFLDRI